MKDLERPYSRRAFLQRLSFAGAAGAVLASCRAESADQVSTAAMNLPSDAADAAVCSDVSGLTEQQIQTRKALEYVDASHHEEKRCDNCRLFKAPAEGEECGTCQVVPGPIHPKGYCTAWTAEAG